MTPDTRSSLTLSSRPSRTDTPPRARRRGPPSSPPPGREAALVVPAAVLGPGGAGPGAGGREPGLLAARPADLPPRDRQVRHAVPGVHDGRVLPRRGPAPAGLGGRCLSVARGQELPGLLHQRHHAADGRGAVTGRHTPLPPGTLP